MALRRVRAIALAWAASWAWTLAMDAPACNGDGCGAGGQTLLQKMKREESTLGMGAMMEKLENMIEREQETAKNTTAAMAQMKDSLGAKIEREQETVQELRTELRAQQQLRAMDHIAPDTPSHESPKATPRGRIPQGAESFELCRAISPAALAGLEANESTEAAQHATTCRPKTHVALFSAKSSAPYYSIQCCPVGQLFCSGCAKMNNRSTGCNTCRGGFSKDKAGRCVACMDIPGWVDESGKNCDAANCSSKKYQGISANDACCKCQGGQRAATHFLYYVAPMAYGDASVIGHPLPRTADHYSVDKGCELLKYGLNIDASTGKLMLAQGCATVGCGRHTNFSVSCKVTAKQSEGLAATASINVVAGLFSYGSAPIILRAGEDAFMPAQAASLSGKFKDLTCSPYETASWLNLNSATGALSSKSRSASPVGSVLDDKGGDLGSGGVCSVQKGSVKAFVVVLAPKTWNSLQYSYGTSSALYATVGERSPEMDPIARSGLAPSRFSASCDGSSFVFDLLTGIATWDGHIIFSLDVKRGSLTVHPEEALTFSLDALPGVAMRRQLDLKCTLFGHYEWSAADAGIVISHRLKLQLRDHTCWAQKNLSFAMRTEQSAGSSSSSSCSALCRKQGSCSHYAYTAGMCYFYSGLCSSIAAGCQERNKVVMERYPGCGERHSCINISLPNYFYLSGEYCSKGENVEASHQGPVYVKYGLTPEDTFWLQRYDKSLQGSVCANGEWVLQRASPKKDYYNSTQAYLELHGSIAACLKSSSADLLSDVFSASSTGLQFKIVDQEKKVEDVAGRLRSGAAASVAIPGCQAPNITGQEGVEEQLADTLVLDDPSTAIADDHWLHPCECAPPAFKGTPPVLAETLSQIPPGSKNEFLPNPFSIVEGEFTCEQDKLAEVIIETEDQALDEGACKAKCLEKECAFFWEGSVMSSKQCRLYKGCDELVRTQGSEGVLYGVIWRKTCRIADPEGCWKTSKRRSFLNAGEDSYPCFFQDLLQQCDHKLLLGGWGVSGCGRCTYAAIEGKQLLTSQSGKCLAYSSSGNVHVNRCHGGKNLKWYFEGEYLKTDKDSKCLTYRSKTGNVYMAACELKSNQRWYFDGAHLKSKHDQKCLDFNTNGNGNVYVGACPDDISGGQWSFSRFAKGSQQLSASSQCLRRSSSNGIASVGTCNPSLRQRIHLDGEQLKNEYDSTCLGAHTTAGKVDWGSCRGSTTQRWYFSGGHLKNRGFNKCLDYNARSGNAYVGSCPNSPSQRWALGPLVSKAEFFFMLQTEYNSRCMYATSDYGFVYMSSRCSRDWSNYVWILDSEGHLMTLGYSTCLEGNHYTPRMVSCSSQASQKWYFDGARIRNRHSSRCLYYDGRVSLLMRGCNHGRDQKWHFKIDKPQLLKHKSKTWLCADTRFDNHNVYFGSCHHRNNQQFYWHGETIRVSSHPGKCLDMDGRNKNVYMYGCHGGSNQKFYWDGERIKVKSARHLCLDARLDNGGNLYVGGCHGGANQKFYFQSRVSTKSYTGKLLRSGPFTCAEYDTGSRKVYARSGCQSSRSLTRLWYWYGEMLKTEQDGNCLYYETSTGKAYMKSSCNGQRYERWYFSGGRLRSRYDQKCLDIGPDNVLYVGKCTTQTWKWKTGLHKSAEIKQGQKCINYRSADRTGTVEKGSCGDTAGYRMWHWHGEQLKTEHDDSKCLERDTSTGNAYMKTCHSNNSNQKWYFEGGHIKSRRDDRCLDARKGTSNNLYVGSCPHHKSREWRFVGAADTILKKTPLPTKFVHGQSLKASCWAERYKSLGAPSEMLTCIAGSWINSRGLPGLSGFKCASCLQVVRGVYKDFDLQGKQELYFVSKMKLQIRVDAKTRLSLTDQGTLSTRGAAPFVAELLPDADETLRRFRSLSSNGKCLEVSGSGLRAAECSPIEPQQFLEPMAFSSLLWDEFKKSSQVPKPQSSPLANKGSAPATLRSFVTHVDCGNHAMESLGFTHLGSIGMNGTCTAASSYGRIVSRVVPLPGSVRITSLSQGSCLSIQKLEPFLLKTPSGGRCADYRLGEKGNVVAQTNCHGATNQQWYWLDQNIYSVRDGKCLDYSLGGNKNVYMHSCHNGLNQKWYIDEKQRFRSMHDHRCLDMDLGHRRLGNLYMGSCHDGTNQKWNEVRLPRIDALRHMPCAEDPSMDIKVEPVGSQPKFDLRSGSITSKGWSWDEKTRRIKNTRNKCLEADDRGFVSESTCTNVLSQEWHIGHGLQGLTDTPIECPGDQVLSFVKKTADKLEYKCSHVSALGSCAPGYSAQVETKDDVAKNKALLTMAAACPSGHGLKGFAAEASDKGAWIRLKYECCQISRLPATMYPTLASGTLREFEDDLAEPWEGVYCPYTTDSSGRASFSQSRSFKPSVAASSTRTLIYDKFKGRWCLSGQSCALSATVHPLDDAIGAGSWNAIAVDDFDGDFRARGIKPPKAPSKRKPPTLIKFGAPDPEYLPECKDESHPGSNKFDQEEMNKEAASLDVENPCKYVYGKAPTTQEGKDGEGSTGWQDDLDKKNEAGPNGATYKAFDDCAADDAKRELQMAKWQEDHDSTAQQLSNFHVYTDGVAATFPGTLAAPWGLGIQYSPAAVGAFFANTAISALERENSDQFLERELRFAQAGHDGCGGLRMGFARTFCDLHCIRDAVRKGDHAILKSLEEAVEIIGKNTQILLEHYIGHGSEDGGASLEQSDQEIRADMDASLAEMSSMAREAFLKPSASMATQRALQSFATRWTDRMPELLEQNGRPGRGNRSANLKSMALEVQQLHSTISMTFRQQMSRAEDLQASTMRDVDKMNELLKVKLHTLGMYTKRSEATKLSQKWLQNQRDPKVRSVLAELQDEATWNTIQSLDSMWWDFRLKFDEYLAATEGHMQAMRAAVSMLRSYTSKCQAGFTSLKNSYAAFVRAERKMHSILQATWAAAVPQVGMMAAKIDDGEILVRLALSDVGGVETRVLFAEELKPSGAPKSFCSKGNLKASQEKLEKALKSAMQKGLLGQTEKQLVVIFGEMAMLQGRYRSAGLGPVPQADVLEAAAQRSKAALNSTWASTGRLATEMLQKLHRAEC